MYQLRELLKHTDFVHAFSTARLGNMAIAYGQVEKVIATREAFLSGVDLSLDRCVFISPEHRSKVLRVDATDCGRGARERTAITCDGLVTNSPDVNLAICVADCIPILAIDPKRGAIGLGHSGYAGTNCGLPQKLIRTMVREFGSDPSTLIIGLGPSIHAISYAKEAERVKQRLQRRWQPYLCRHADTGLYLVDVLAYAKSQLARSGIASANILLAPHDTFTTKLFFSSAHDSKHDQRRFLAVIGRRLKAE